MAQVNNNNHVFIYTDTIAEMLLTSLITTHVLAGIQ